MTDVQKFNLKKAYDIEKFGVEQYKYISKIKEIIENFHLIKNISFSTKYEFKIDNSVANNLNELTVFSHLILDDAQKNNKKIKICLPATNCIYKLIRDAVCLHGSLSLEHILYLENDNQNYKNMYNLAQFENCLPTLFSNRCSIKYSYQHSISNLFNQNVYPYSIHSQNYSLLLNCQLNSGLLLQGEHNQYLHTQFNHLFNNAQLYNSYSQSSLGYLNYHHFFKGQMNDFFLIQSKPSILFILDKDMLDRHFIGTDKQYQTILNFLNNYKSHIINILSFFEFHMYFTKNGLSPRLLTTVRLA